MEGCKKFASEGGLQVPSPLSVIKAAYKELAEHKAPIFGEHTSTNTNNKKKSTHHMFAKHCLNWRLKVGT